MNETVNIICYRQKALKNGEHPIMIRVSKDGKKKYKSLGLSVHPDYWDFEKNRPKPNCPNRELILKTILEREAEFQKEILELTSMLCIFFDIFFMRMKKPRCQSQLDIRSRASNTRSMRFPLYIP